jgi:hypothetical protein
MPLSVKRRPMKPPGALPARAPALALTGALALVVLTAGLAHAAPPGRALSASPIRASSAWKRYVINPGPLVYPKRVRVLGAAGAVSNPNGLKAEGGGVTTIDATGAGAPRLVLDLGVNTGGKVEVGITRTDGTRVRLGYAELLGFLTPFGDNVQGSLGSDDNPDGRTDVIFASAPVRSSRPGSVGQSDTSPCSSSEPGASRSITYACGRCTCAPRRLAMEGTSTRAVGP